MSEARGFQFPPHTPPFSGKLQHMIFLLLAVGVPRHLLFSSLKIRLYCCAVILWNILKQIT